MCCINGKIPAHTKYKREICLHTSETEFKRRHAIAVTKTGKVAGKNR